MLEHNYDPQEVPRRMYDTGREEAPVISLGEWIRILLLMVVPILNLVMLLVWSLDTQSNPTRRNFARAYLIFTAFGILLTVLFMGLIMGLMTRFTTLPMYQ